MKIINPTVYQTENYIENVSRCFCKEEDRKSKKKKKPGTGDFKGKIKGEKKDYKKGDTDS